MSFPSLVRRIIGSIVAAFISSLVVFAVFFVVPGGDPALRLAGPQATPETIAEVSKAYGFDRPLYDQYASTMHNLFTNDLVSYANRSHVVSEIFSRLAPTAALAVGAIVLGIVMSLAAGLAGAYFKGRWPAAVVSTGSMVLVSAPTVFIAIELQHVLGQSLGVLPDSGYVPMFDNPINWALHLVLPCFVLALPVVAYTSRLLRANLIEAREQPYVKTARAKGVPWRTIWLRHILRNAVLPVTSAWGLEFGAMLGGGTILVERIFNVPGIGLYAAQGVDNLDLPVLIGVSLLGAVFVIAINLAVDVAYRFIDPRAEVHS